ncbi:beta-L-arabinofuranosidase domain-containing protein [Pelagicoccus mobilis]|uniref:Glycoside hydrolase family 127 protein n=1 Tax=Pelagicoccus mobilis TaxID=415221 RepID=A0A934RXV2_9BACT|nr:beta-L-arabinofuranosidase domain-containing protein [Pelagicoccus mobilis]MBK1879730.1 glycoside hydrolase family 127 protein [Pelagicoccus mobilis]
MSFSPLGAFTPTKDLWNRLQRNFNRLEEEKFWPQNIFQREKAFERWPGDIEGRTLLGWVLLSQATGHAPRYLEETLRLWPSELNERGYYGRIYDDGISEQQLSSHGWVLQALAELHRWDPESPAREFALPIINNLFLPTKGAYKKYPIEPSSRESGGSYSGSHLKQVGEWILSTDVGCFTIGMTGLIDATEAFGLRDELSPLIEEMIGRFLEMDLDLIQAQTHATLTACRGVIRWAKLTGRSELMEEIERRYRLYIDLAWTETHANFNWFGRPQWTEPCAVVDSLMVAMELWLHTKDDVLLEQAQLIWFNALGHGQRSNGGFGCDNCPGSDGELDLFYKTDESHWCCTMRGAEGLARMSQFQAIVDGDTLYLPFLLPGDYEWDGLKLSIESEYPHEAKMTLRVVNNESSVKRLKLFIPHWWTEAKSSAGGLDDGWCTVSLHECEDVSLSGVLDSGYREILSSTRQFAEAKGHAQAFVGRVAYHGPLVLATKAGRADEEKDTDELEPIFTNYLSDTMDTERSYRRLILTD